MFSSMSRLTRTSTLPPHLMVGRHWSTLLRFTRSLWTPLTSALPQRKWDWMEPGWGRTRATPISSFSSTLVSTICARTGNRTCGEYLNWKCANWQSHLRRVSKLVSLAGFKAEAGKVYYFRARIIPQSSAVGGQVASLELEPVNSDDGQLLVASSSFSTSHPRK